MEIIEGALKLNWVLKSRLNFVVIKMISVTALDLVWYMVYTAYIAVASMHAYRPHSKGVAYAGTLQMAAV